MIYLAFVGAFVFVLVKRVLRVHDEHRPRAVRFLEAAKGQHDIRHIHPRCNCDDLCRCSKSVQLRLWESMSTNGPNCRSCRRPLICNRGLPYTHDYEASHNQNSRSTR